MEVFRVVGQIALEGGREAQRAIEKVSDQASHMGRNLSNAGAAMTAAGTHMMGTGAAIAGTFGTAAAGIGAAFGQAIGVTMDFEAQMDRVGAISQATGEQMQQMTDLAMELGATTSKSASEVAIGMENLAASGFEVNEIMAAMPGVIAAAEASGTDMAQVSEVMASALNAFGMEASESTHIADVLAQTANQSAASVTDLQYAFKYAAPVANTLGISLEQLSAATGMMVDAGLAGEQAGTTLRMALLRLVDPPTAAAETMADLGIQVTDAQGNMLPFVDIIRQFSDATDGMSGSQKAAALSTIFGTEAVTGMLAVIERGPDELAKLTKGLEESGGASEKAAKAMKDNLKGAVDELSGSFETMQITVGTALTPTLLMLADKVQQLADWFNNLSPAAQQTIVWAGVIVGLLLGAITVFGLLGVAIGGVITFLGTLTTIAGFITGTILPALGTAFAALTWPVALVVAAVVAAIAIFKNWGTIGPWLQGIWQSFLTWMSGAWSGFQVWFAGIWQGALTVLQNFGNWLMSFPAIQNFVNGAKAVFAELKDFFTITWDMISSIFSIIWQRMYEAVVPKIQKIWSSVTQKFTDLQNRISQIFESARSAVATKFSQIYTAVSGKVQSIWQTVKDKFDAAKKAMTGPIETAKGVIDGILSSISKAFSGLKWELPSLKLPRVNVSRGTKTFMGKEIPVPVFDVSWKARGGFFDSPSIVGLGEAGREAIVPLENRRYMAPFAEAIAAQLPSNPDRLSGTIEVPVYLNDREIARAVAPAMNQALERERRVTNRGRGLI